MCISWLELVLVRARARKRTWRPGRPVSVSRCWRAGPEAQKGLGGHAGGLCAHRTGGTLRDIVACGWRCCVVVAIRRSSLRSSRRSTALTRAQSNKLASATLGRSGGSSNSNSLISLSRGSGVAHQIAAVLSLPLAP